MGSHPFAHWICHLGFSHFAQKNFTHSFWLNLMMAAILNSAMLDSDTAILDSDTLFLLSDSLKNTLTPLWLWLKLIQSDSNSFILTQLDDGSHLEFCHLGFCHLGFRHLVFFSQIHSKTLSQLWLWLKLIQSDSNSFILTQLDDGSHLEFSWILPSLDSAILHKTLTQTNSIWLHSFILTQLDDGSHLEFCHLGFRPSWIQTPCYLLSDSLKNTLTPLWLWLKLIQSDSNSFILTQLDDGSHLEFCHLGFSHLGFSHLSFSSQTHSHLPRLVPTICTKKTSLIHSDSTWWWQPSWILPCWIQTLPSWIQTPCYLLSDSLKNTLTPLWLWLKLIQSDSNSFILT